MAVGPPDGGFLAAIPTEFIQKARKYLPSPTIAHGQALVWAGKDGGMQGITELVQCERCDDDWLRAVQHEIRTGSLSADNHAFLHGRPTSVPGSWMGDDVGCRNAACKALVQHGGKQTCASNENYIQSKECSKCKADRASRALVAMTDKDPRFKKKCLLNAQQFLRTMT